MTRRLIGRNELERLALREIRSFAGGEFVTSVRIESQRVDATGEDWSIHAFGRKGGNIEVIQCAISTTGRRLRNQYSLRLEARRHGAEASRNRPLADKGTKTVQ
jgi:hypothetical protein